MNFDSKREDLLKQLNTMNREKETKRVNQAVKARLHADSKAKESGMTERAKVEQSMKPKVLVFSKVRIFVGTLKSILGAYCDVVEFDDAEKATDYIIDNHIPIVIMDMDPPNDWKQCHDIFTTGKTMYPDIEYIVFQKEKSISTEIAMLEAQGADILNKPVNQMVLIQSIKEIVKKRESL